ncbi:MAG: nucleotidyltransferase family protein, partial [Jatrophihabitantaceae bacterium]
MPAPSSQIVASRRPASSELVRLLAATATDADRGAQRLNEVPDEQAGPVIAAARAHGLEAWLAGASPDRPAWAELAAQRPRFVAARARSRAELDRFGALADRLAMPWLAVKGQAVAESLYPRPQLRYGVDIDVLVPPDRFAELTENLTGAGWQLVDLNWPLTARTRPGQLRYLSPTGGLFDVHWNLMNNPRLRAGFPMPTQLMLDRRRQLESGLWALSPDDQLVHLAVHAALSGACRLVWLLDLALAARQVADWPALADAAGRAGAGPAVGLVLGRAQHWFDSPVPARNARGAGPCWRAITAAADRLSPLTSDPERPALARSLARSTRASTGKSLVEFGRHLAAFL